MEKKTYTYDELCQMSYQELRRLSILLRLPANIKKKHMISMIEAHQKGDGQTKTEIANKVMEERSLRRMNIQMKRAKPFILSSRVRTHQVSADLSLANKHEFETRYSFVAHYTKANKGSRISGIIREEAEVSGRNRSVVQQSSKSTRKLAAVGRTEIMLPRNHSLTTLVQLMPQHERSIIPSSKATRVLTSETNWNASINYESSPVSPTVSDYHSQGGSPFVYGNLTFPPEYGNSFISSSSHELYRSLPYWHARELYNSVVPGNLIIPVMPNMIGSEVSTTHCPAQSSMTMSSTSNFQRQYESFARCSENGLFDSEREVNSSTGLLNVYNSQEHNAYGGGGARSEADGSCDYSRRQDALTRHGSDVQSNESLTYLVDIFAPRSSEQANSSPETIRTVRNSLMGCVKQTEFSADVAYPLIKPRSAEEMSRAPRDEDYPADVAYPLIKPRSTEEMSRAPVCEDYHMEECDDQLGNQKPDGYILGVPDDPGAGNRFDQVDRSRYSFTQNTHECLNHHHHHHHNHHQEQAVLPSFMSTFHEMQSPESLASEICIDSPGMSQGELDRSNEREEHENAISVTMSNFSHCRYIAGHNQFPESISKPYSTTMSAPLFSAPAYSGQDCSYSVCRDSSTETTAIHSHPIMTSGKANRFEMSEPEREWNGTDVGNGQSMQDMSNGSVGNLQHYQRSVFYSYPEDHSPYDIDSGTYSNWSEFSEDLSLAAGHHTFNGSSMDPRFIQHFSCGGRGNKRMSSFENGSLMII